MLKAFNRNYSELIKSRYFLIFLAFSIGIGIRLYLAFAYYGNFDQESFEIVADIVSRGGNVYAETFRYNYSPLWSYILLLLKYCSVVLNLPFHFVSRGFLTLIDCFIAILVGLIAAKSSPSSGISSSIAYILNPVAILLVGYHGQFENLATLPLLLAVYISLIKTRQTKWVIVLSTLALLIKHIVAFGVWTIYVFITKSRFKAFTYISLSGLVFLLSFLPFLPEGKDGILNGVLLYRGAPINYGLSALFPAKMVFPIFIGMMVVLPMYSRKKMNLPLVKAMELCFVSFLVLTPGISVQWFILPIIWGSISRSRMFWIYTFLMSIALIGSKTNINLISIPQYFINVVWISLVAWLMSFFITWKYPNRRNSS